MCRKALRDQESVPLFGVGINGQDYHSSVSYQCGRLCVRDGRVGKARGPGLFLPKTVVGILVLGAVVGITATWVKPIDRAGTFPTDHARGCSP